ncbi:hypothetical protein HYPSUDRAFT_209044 [Hypholoma sublateritium FD-334 SS-4]|uniref:Uncharacterized protein n=1 Tax=Hypholoma sublateritium (strain FD-334 SS-4) TaxID=945553 RepID=A0A0D2LT51_HYPSF|nr:hypothetical protein HYPSUDRAFT_209044 [Hypholoma sublateritium FD-334 SS-4]
MSDHSSQSSVPSSYTHLGAPNFEMTKYSDEHVDLPPISDCTPEDARILPSFADLDASIESSAHTETSTTLFIFPPSAHVPFPRLVSAGEPDPLPTLIYPSPERPYFWAALWEEPQCIVPYIKVQLRFRGPERLCVYRPEERLRITPAASRVHASVRAQWLLHEKGETCVAPPAPDADSVSVNLSYVAIETLPTMSQTEFGFLLQALVPWPDAPLEHYVAEWCVTCPYCATDVPGYSSDKVWNERFIRHIDESGCREGFEARERAKSHRSKL